MTPFNRHATASAVSRALNGQAPHVARYLARVDDRLVELPDDQSRREFLDKELARTQQRYDDFIAIVNAGRDVGDVSAFDYVETIAALDGQLGKLNHD